MAKAKVVMVVLGRSYEEWMAEVDSAIGEACGLSHDDLADAGYWDAWAGGMEPEEMAAEVLASEGFPVEGEE
jgi:hypothetical protein